MGALPSVVCWLFAFTLLGWILGMVLEATRSSCEDGGWRVLPPSLATLICASISLKHRHPQTEFGFFYEVLLTQVEELLREDDEEELEACQSPLNTPS